jgi:hypothetical protein
VITAGNHDPLNIAIYDDQDKLKNNTSASFIDNGELLRKTDASGATVTGMTCSTTCSV